MKKFSRVMSVMLAVLLILTALPVYAGATEEYPSIEIDIAVTVTQDTTFKFVAPKSTTYTFYSYDNYDPYYDSYTHVYAFVYNSNMEHMHTYDGISNDNCAIEFVCTQGETYYLEVGSYGGQYKVKVQETPKATGVLLNGGKDIKLFEGETVSLEYVLVPEISFYEYATFKVANENIASVNDIGDLLALSDGKTTVTVTTQNGLTNTVNLEVIGIDEIKVDDEKTVSEELNGVGYYYFTPEESGYYTFYSYDNESLDGYYDTQVYIYNENGEEIKYDDDSAEDFNFAAVCYFESGKRYKLEANARGEACSYKVALIKTQAPTSVMITNKQWYKAAFTGTKQNLVVEFLPKLSIPEALTYSSSDEDVITVNEFGEVNFLSQGVATITVMSENGLSDSVEITVFACEDLELYKEYSVRVSEDRIKEVFRFVPETDGEYYFYSYDNYSLNGEEFDVKATICDSDMEEIESDDDGGDGYNYKLEVELYADETYYFITESIDDQSDGSYKFKAIKPVDATDLKLTVNDGINTAYVGDELESYVSFEPFNAVSERVRYTSSDENIARIDSYGTITLLSKGIVDITASSRSSSLFDTVTLTVLEIPEIKEDVETKINYSSQKYLRKFYFIPSETGFYNFAVSNVQAFVKVSKANGDTIGSSDSKLNVELIAGQRYIISAGSQEEDFSEDFYVYVNKGDEIKSVEITKLPNRFDYYKGFEEFEYYGLEAEITIGDVTYTWTPDLGDDLEGYEVLLREKYNEETGEYDCTEISCGTKSDTFKFNITECPVTSIELVSLPENNLYYENYNGYFSEIDGSEHFIYYHHIIDDAKIKINFNDSTSVIKTIGEGFNGYRFVEHNTQYSNPWKVGNKNNITIELFNFNLKIPVELKANPIKSITVTKNPTKQYIFGDYEYGYIEGDTYYLIPEALDGLEFTVEYSDSTQKTYTHLDINKGFVLNGENLHIKEIPINSYGIHEAIFTYMGIEATFEVEVIPTVVESVEIIKQPTLNTYSCWYIPLCYGAEFKINYINGTSATFTATKDNVKTVFSPRRGLMVYIEYLDHKIFFVTREDQTDEGKVIYTVNVLGVEGVFDTIIDTEPNAAVSVTTEDVSWTGKAMTFDVKFADGTNQTVKLLKTYYMENTNGSMYGFAETEYGILNYEIYRNDFNHTICIYDYEVLITYLGSRGDVNGDGKENTSDLATLKKLIAGLIPATDSSVVAPDVDETSDGVTTSDLALLKKRIAGIA